MVLALFGSATCRPADEVRLTGAGATFPHPLYAEWIATHQRAHPKVGINYQPIGSGGGIRQLMAGTVDFGGSDTPMSDSEMERAGRRIVHVPMAAGAVVVAYNIPVAGLRLDARALVDVFSGEVTRWDDARIRDLNPTISLPAQAIAVVHRSDGSGTTAAFTTYLSRASERWRASVGAGHSVRWPTGIGAKGNDGVTAQVAGLSGAIGYVDLAHALQSSLRVARLESTPGHFVAPSVESASAALRSFVPRIPEDLRVTLVEASEPDAYPITALTYVLVHHDGPDAKRRRALAEFLWWAVHDGQARCAELHYVPLPPALVERVETRLRSLTADGQPLLAPAGPR